MNKQWHKSSYSDGRGGNCVEVSEGSTTGIRDTQNRDLGQLDVPLPEWNALLNAIRTS
ncbi:DUF397 domain-containing protein [Nocardiopsis alba]|jgi:hypothetical protein|uniref:DUF397 domain-containing protein n=1 Tax=Nocardiopsis alba TaxID=53437 RepID=UPI0003497FF7|nr:DUF397 domain-containing protein [Nocardiopsis alba]